MTHFAAPPGTRQLLHVGCGRHDRHRLKGFGGPEWNEVRLDINPAVRPDIVGTLTDMAAVPSASVDALYSSHNIEHLYPHEVPLALAEFHRVLRDDGFAVITCPDLQAVAAAVAANRLLEPLYESGMGPISAIDILYGHRGEIAAGNEFMAHRCGFTYDVLQNALFDAGFRHGCGGRREPAYDLWIVAFKSPIDPDAATAIARHFLP